jgi:hypothetical protein
MCGQHSKSGKLYLHVNDEFKKWQDGLDLIMAVNVSKTKFILLHTKGKKIHKNI